MFQLFFFINSVMKDHKITFLGRKEICENTFSFTFNMNNSGYDFKAGQYAHFTIKDPALHSESGKSRPLSIASSPHHVNSIMVAARKKNSEFIENLLSLSPGSEVFISEPEGNIGLHEDESIENVFITGGIGITPVRSIVEFATENNLRNKIFLFYSNISRDQAAFTDEFINWSEENDHFRFIPFFEKVENAEMNFESGRIDAERLKKHLGNFDNIIFNIIGPPEMVNSVKEILIKENVPEEFIRSEKFS